MPYVCSRCTYADMCGVLLSLCNSNTKAHHAASQVILCSVSCMCMDGDAAILYKYDATLLERTMYVLQPTHVHTTVHAVTWTAVQGSHIL